jgi:hypothetical protein
MVVRLSKSIKEAKSTKNALVVVCLIGNFGKIASFPFKSGTNYGVV